MADNLSTLPYPSGIKYNQDELDAHSLFAGQHSATASSIGGGIGGGSRELRFDMKMFIIITAAFFILSSPIAARFIERIPYATSSFSKLVITTILFALLLAIIFFFYN